MDDVLRIPLTPAPVLAPPTLREKGISRTSVVPLHKGNIQSVRGRICLGRKDFHISSSVGIDESFMRERGNAKKHRAGRRPVVKMPAASSGSSASAAAGSRAFRRLAADPSTVGAPPAPWARPWRPGTRPAGSGTINESRTGGLLALNNSRHHVEVFNRIVLNYPVAYDSRQRAELLSTRGRPLGPILRGGTAPQRRTSPRCNWPQVNLRIRSRLHGSVGPLRVAVFVLGAGHESWRSRREAARPGGARVGSPGGHVCHGDGGFPGACTGSCFASRVCAQHVQQSRHGGPAGGVLV